LVIERAAEIYKQHPESDVSLPVDVDFSEWSSEKEKKRPEK
jgi:hypothetical protein